MNKHTPGPWRVDYLETGSARWPVIVGAGDEPNEIAELSDCVWTLSPDDAECRRAKANARLIAAAPEMYDLLRALRRTLDGNLKSAQAIDGLLAKIDGAA